MSFSFYLKSALKNIGNNKRQAFIFTFSIFISISILISLQLWSSTAEDLAATDFLEDQDFEMKVTTYLPDELPFITGWLETDPLVKDTYGLMYNLAAFNAEDKPLDYRWFPENDQENMSDPISISSLGLFPKKAMSRIESQFYVRGSFDIGLNECLISEYEALQLGRIYGYEIEPGMNVTLSVARNSPERGEVFLHQMQLKHYVNVTVKGIYRPIPGITMLQKTFSASFLRDSVIFLLENIDEITLIEMHANGLEPVIMVKTNIDMLKEDGIGQILNKLNDLADRLKVTFQSSQFIILDSPTRELQQSYSLAHTAIVFTVPVVAVSVILALFTNNIILEKRRSQFTTLKDRGGQNWQIISIILLEFLILSIIGIIIGIAASFILSAFIPTIASGSFSSTIFKLFIRNVIFPLTLTLYITLGTLLIITVFTIIKMQMILVNKLEEKIIIRRKKIQIAAAIVTILGILGFIIGFLIKNIVELQEDTNEIYNFTVEQSQQSRLIFLLIACLIMILVVICTLAYNGTLGRASWLYKRFFFNNSFFVSNSLKKSKNKFSILLIVFILVGSFNIFSLNIYSTLKHNEDAVSYYNNGSDLRVHTSFVDTGFADNISAIDGVNEVMPVLRADGRLIYNRVTVYGIDPIIYSRIGRWNSVYRNHDEINTMMSNLNQTDNGAIISEYVANRLNLTVGSQITVTGLPNISYVEVFIVQGVLSSAPGLGLSYGMNIELSQPNEEYLLINQRTMENNYAVSDTNLFFASTMFNVPFEDIEEELMNLSDVIDINPKIINQQFVGKYISQYIPNARVFLFIQILLVNLVGLIITASIIDFTLKQRDQNNAILTTLGNSNNNLAYLIISELLVVEIASFLAALLLGIPFSFLAITVNRPSFFAHNILPVEFSFNYIGVFTFIAALILLSIIMTLPLLIRFSRKNLANILRN
ncbi:MAG: ABC transporter permease [Asgard group archaeon]|nr:ABC transporter permease [Asgard group archaeon]